MYDFFLQILASKKPNKRWQIFDFQMPKPKLIALFATYHSILKHCYWKYKQITWNKRKQVGMSTKMSHFCSKPFFYQD